MIDNSFPTYRDERGHLLIISPYHFCALTLPGRGRDKDKWHRHRIQTEIFVPIMGVAALATSLDGKQVIINILDGQHPENQITVKPGTYHSLITIGDKPSIMIVGRDVPYDPDDNEWVQMIEWTWDEEEWVRQINSGN